MTLYLPHLFLRGNKACTSPTIVTRAAIFRLHIISLLKKEISVSVKLQWSIKIHNKRVAFCTASARQIKYTAQEAYRISLKSRHGEILFQRPVWWGNNSRVARFRGRRLQRSIRTRVHCSNDKLICMHV